MPEKYESSWPKTITALKVISLVLAGGIMHKQNEAIQIQAETINLQAEIIGAKAMDVTRLRVCDPSVVRSINQARDWVVENYEPIAQKGVETVQSEGYTGLSSIDARVFPEEFKRYLQTFQVFCPTDLESPSIGDSAVEAVAYVVPHLPGLMFFTSNMYITHITLEAAENGLTAALNEVEKIKNEPRAIRDESHSVRPFPSCSAAGTIVHEAFHAVTGSRHEEAPLDALRENDVTYQVASFAEDLCVAGRPKRNFKY